MTETRLTEVQRHGLRLMVYNGVARSWQLAIAMGCTTDQARRILLALERKAVVERHERYSAVNDIYWQITPAGRALLEGEG